MTENTCVTVNWIRGALKVTAGYIPAPTGCLILNQTTKDRKSLTALHRRSFVALTRNKGSLILTVKTMLFYFTFDYSISIAVNQILKKKCFGYMAH